MFHKIGRVYFGMVSYSDFCLWRHIITSSGETKLPRSPKGPMTTAPCRPVPNGGDQSTPQRPVAYHSPLLGAANVRLAEQTSLRETKCPTLELADLGLPLGNLTRQNPVVPLAQDDPSFLPIAPPAAPWSVIRDTSSIQEPGRLRTASHDPAKSAGSAKSRSVPVLRSPSARSRQPFTHASHRAS